MPTPTLYDVAAAAGLGFGTVSRALSGKGSVAPGTRKRVLEVAERLGYSPSAAARALAAGRKSGRPAGGRLLAAYVRSSPWTDTLFLQACRDQGFDGICVGPEAFESPRAAVRQLYARGVDAILVNPRRIAWTASQWSEAEWDRVSVVVLGRNEQFHGFEVVRHSAFDYMRTALNALRDEGFRRILVLMHRSTSDADDDARLGAVLAFQQRERASGLRVHVELVPGGIEAPDIDFLRRVSEKGRHDVLLFDHVGFVQVLRASAKGRSLLAMPFGAGITGDRDDPFNLDVSGCPVNRSMVYAQALRALFEQVQAGRRGRREYPVEHVVEPVWESRASTRRVPVPARPRSATKAERLAVDTP